MRYSIDKRIHEALQLLRRSLQWLEINHPIESAEGKALKEMLIADIEKHLERYSGDKEG